jgi:hypothetical protein
MFMKFLMILALALGTVSNNAHAMFAPLTPGKVASTWEVQYAGQTSFDGMDVVVTLEKSERTLRAPVVLSSVSIPLDTKPSTKQTYRLSIIAVNQPEIRVNFAMEQRRNINNDKVESVFTSIDTSREFIFNVIGQEGNVLTVSYSRRIADGEVQHGTFELNPIQTVMGY